MKLLASIAALLALASPAFATTYSFTLPLYQSIQNYTASPCNVGTCANFEYGMRGSGSFTTAAPLGPNFSGDASSLVTSYSFSDGLNTYSSTDPNARIVTAEVVTDGGGNITAEYIVVEVWTSGSAPHAIGDRTNFMVLFTGELYGALNNAACTDSVTEPADTCSDPQQDTYSSLAIAALPLAPTLSPVGLGLCAVMLGGAGFWFMRGRRQVV